MKHTIKNSLYSFSLFQKDILANAFKNLPVLKGNLFEHLLKKYLWQFLILILILAGSFASQILPTSI